MSADERQPVRINTQEAANWHGQPQRQVCPLFSGTSETVLLQKLAPGERIFCAPLVGGAEILLLQGELHAPEGCYGQEAGCGASETVQLQKLAPGERIFCAPLVGGAELILLQGEIRAPEGRYESGSWLRFPPGDMPALIATASGALFYLKTGHLSPTTLTGATL